jgi:hypothetical protein
MKTNYKMKYYIFNLILKAEKFYQELNVDQEKDYSRSARLFITASIIINNDNLIVKNA